MYFRKLESRKLPKDPPQLNQAVRRQCNADLRNVPLAMSGALVLMGSIALAQPQPLEALSAAERATTIEDIARLMDENYVFPKIGAECAALIRDREKSGDYDNLTTGSVFAAKLTDDLRSICHDLHVGVRMVPPADVDAITSPEAQAEQQVRQLASLRRQNYGFAKLEILAGNIGYLDLRGFHDTETPGAGEAAVAALGFLANTDAVVIDLRQNGGGAPSMIQLLSSYFFEERTHLNSFFWRGQEQIEQRWTLPYVSGSTLYDTPLYILTSPRTGSAAEEFTYNMKHLERATIIGEVTWGGAHPGDMHRVGSQFSIFVPQGRAINPVTETNWEGVGVQPDIAVAAEDALDYARLEALKSLQTTVQDDAQRASLDWAVTGLEGQLNPVVLEPEMLQKYVGNYGPRSVKYVEGDLYYQREGGSEVKMSALTNDTFAVEGIDFFRMRFVMDTKTGQINKIVGMYDNGRTDESVRD